MFADTERKKRELATEIRRFDSYDGPQDQGGNKWKFIESERRYDYQQMHGNVRSTAAVWKSHELVLRWHTSTAVSRRECPETSRTNSNYAQTSSR